MKILHCPSSVGGNAWTLSRAERELGLDSEVMVYQNSWLGYPADIDLHFERTATITNGWKLLRFFLKALRRYDVFHFNAGRSFFPRWDYLSFLEHDDLPILKALGKKIVVTFQGCEVRQRNFCIDNFAVSACVEPDCYAGVCEADSGMLKKKKADKIRRYSHKIFALNPDLLHVLPSEAEFLPYASVDLKKWQPARKSRNRKLVIVHSPTKRSVKGTRYILDAVEKLQVYYKDIELLVVENIPHSKVREVYQKADIAIDQLLVGWYGGFAVEMMALGKPVICYIREEDLKFIPAQMKEELPIINAGPGNLYEVMKQLIEDRDSLGSIGERCRSYVERWHDPVKIAAMTKEVYEKLHAG